MTEYDVHLGQRGSTPCQCSWQIRQAQSLPPSFLPMLTTLSVIFDHGNTAICVYTGTSGLTVQDVFKLMDRWLVV